MKKVWEKGLILLLCLTVSSPITVFANEGQNLEIPSQEAQNLGDQGQEEQDLNTSTIPEVSDKPGWKEIDNNRYYYDADKCRAEGWRKIDHVWYYFDGDNETYPGIMLKDTVHQVEDKFYIFRSDGAMLTGWIERPEGWYYANPDGSLAFGWKNSKNRWYYLDRNNSENIGLMAENTTMLIDGRYYEFDSNGVMLTGWIKKAEGWYYANPDGSYALGWKKVGNRWYYLDGNNSEHVGLMAENTRMLINGRYYEFDSNGAMLTGWIKKAEGWYYANPDGSYALGWKKVGNRWYYLDGNNSEHVGLMAENTRMLIDGKYYEFDSNGVMLTGWIEKEEGWYYANPKGEFVMNWVQSKGRWYYLDPNDAEYPGRMLSDVTVEINGFPYTFLSTGAMKTGWDQVDGKWYYYDTYSGQPVSDWKKIGGKWYYFMPDTKEMAPAGWHEIEGTYYFMNANGDMATGWIKVDNKWYYMGGSGNMHVGWQVVDGFWYYFYSKNDPHGGPYGAMASNTTIDGYRIHSNGMYMTAVQARMYAMAQGYSSRTGYLIMIDTVNCTMGVFNGMRGNWNFVKYWNCSTGAPETPTVKGVFSVGSKGYYFDSGNLRLYWYTQFYGDYLIHSVCYLHDGSPADLRTGLHLSHGCVRLKIENAKWVYDRIPRGSTVVTY